MLLTVLLIIGTMAVLGVAGYALFRMGADHDEEFGATGLTKNQWRLVGWLLVLLLGIIGAIIEWKIVLG